MFYFDFLSRAYRMEKRAEGTCRDISDSCDLEVHRDGNRVLSHLQHDFPHKDSHQKDVLSKWDLFHSKKREQKGGSGSDLKDLQSHLPSACKREILPVRE